MAAFDLGSITGWATWDGEQVMSGTQEFPVVNHPALRFKAFREWALRLILPGTKLVIYERAHMRNARTTEFMNALVVNLKEACAERKANTLGVHSLTLKKFVTGHGHAAKAEMYRAGLAHGWFDGQRIEYGLLARLDAAAIGRLDDRFDPINNQVDAIGCLYWGAKYGGLSIELPGEPGFDAPPPFGKGKATMSEDEQDFMRLSKWFDPSVTLEEFKDE